jgi:transposase
MENERKSVGNAEGMVLVSRAEYEELKLLKEQNAELSQQVQWLMEQMRLAKKRMFGASSEQTGAEVEEQLSLLFNEAEVHADIERHETVEIAEHVRKKTSGIQKDNLPEDVPTEVVTHDLPENKRVCPNCGTAMEKIGQEVHRTLVMVPAQVKVREDVYPVYACRNCEKNGIETPIVKTPKDKAVIPGSFASPEAIAHIMTQKFVMGSPLYRQEQEFKYAGIALSRQTMSNWILKASDDWLTPVFETMHAELLKHEILHADETTLQVLHEPGKPAQSKSYVWLYRTGRDAVHPIVLYEYQPDRKADNPISFLKGFHGYLHTDGYQAYGKLENVTLVGCWAHARRKFDEAVKALPKSQQKKSSAGMGLLYCNRLFEIEDKLAKFPPQKRDMQRQNQAKPVLGAFLAWAKTRNAAPKSALGQALHYLLEQWPRLNRYLDDGRLEISNNLAERSIKPFVMGRKNFLFANTQSGARGSTTMFSLIQTARENCLDPFRYLTYVFQTAPNLDPQDPGTVQLLLPWNAPENCKAKRSTKN